MFYIPKVTLNSFKEYFQSTEILPLILSKEEKSLMRVLFYEFSHKNQEREMKMRGLSAVKMIEHHLCGLFIDFQEVSIVSNENEIWKVLRERFLLV